MNVANPKFMLNRHLSVCGILLIGVMGCTARDSRDRSTEPSLAGIPATSQETIAPQDAPIPTLVAKQTSDRRTVADYFLAMPAKYLADLANKPISNSKRQQMLTSAKRGESGGVYDLKNGYLSMNRGGDTCNLYTITIFNRPTGTPLVASNISCTVGDTVVILDPAQNWKDVTKAVLPVDLTPSPDLKYTVAVVLPRTGRSIEVSHENEDGSKKPIGRYRFENQRFVKE